MLRTSLALISFVISVGVSTPALADYPPPTPPFESTPECDIAARQYARHSGVVGSPAYNSAYYDYYFENCPIH